MLATLIYMAGAYDRLSSDMDGWLLLKVAGLCTFFGAVLASCWDLVVLWSVRRRWLRLGSIIVTASSALLLWIALVFNFANLSVNY